MFYTLTLKGELTTFYTEAKDFFINIWNSIRGFFLQYMSENVFNVTVLAVGIIAILFILLAIINKN